MHVIVSVIAHLIICHFRSTQSYLAVIAHTSQNSNTVLINKLSLKSNRNAFGSYPHRGRDRGDGVVSTRLNHLFTTLEPPSSWINSIVPSPTTRSYAGVSRPFPHSSQTSRQARGVSRTASVHPSPKVPEG